MEKNIFRCLMADLDPQKMTFRDFQLLVAVVAPDEVVQEYLIRLEHL